MAKRSRSKSNNDLDFEIKIRPKKWTAEELENVKAFIRAHNATRTPAQKLRTKLLAIKYKLDEIEFNSKGII